MAEKVDKKTGEIVKVSRIETAALVPGTTIWDRDACEHAQMVALDLSNSQLVPTMYRNSPPNCFVAMHRSNAMSVDVLTFMEQTFYVESKLGMYAKFGIALANRSDIFEGGIQWEMSGTGDTRQAKAWAKRKGTGEMCEMTVTIAMSKSEGWYGRNPKWKSIPDLMLQYRSAMWLIRLYCPEVILGMSSVEELRDIEQDVLPPPPMKMGKEAFGARKVRELEADDVVEPAPEPTEAPTAAQEAPESAPEPSEAEDGPFAPSVGQYVQNGPRGMVVRVVSLDPPQVQKWDGTVRGMKAWPENTQAWVPKGDEMIPLGWEVPPPVPEPAGNEPDSPAIPDADPASPAEEPPAPDQVPEPEPEPMDDPPAPLQAPVEPDSAGDDDENWMK